MCYLPDGPAVFPLGLTSAGAGTTPSFRRQGMCLSNLYLNEYFFSVLEHLACLEVLEYFSEVKYSFALL